MQMAREGSGTSWLPDTTPMYALHWQRGAWRLMAHENAFVQFFHESGDRGDEQLGSINWIMGMAQRNVGAGSPAAQRHVQRRAVDDPRLRLPRSPRER